MRRVLIAAAVLLVSFACAGAPAFEPAPEPPVVLGPAPPADGELVISADLERTLRAERRAGALVVHLDGAPVASGVDEAGRLGFLADGTPHAAYRRGDAWYQVVGGQRSGPYEALGPRLVAAGRHTAFRAARRGRWHTVIDGREGASWERTGPPLLSPSGRAAWVGEQDGRAVVLKGGRALATADEAVLARLTEDGRLAWAGRDGAVWQVHVDEAPLPGAWLAVGAVALGERWAFSARDARGWWIVTEAGRRGPVHAVGEVGFAPDGRLVWTEETPEGWRLRVGEWTSHPVGEVGAPVFDGARFLWWARDAAEVTVYVGRRPLAEVRELAPVRPWFAGGRPAFVARGSAGWQVHVGDWRTPPVAEIARAATSPDGSFLAVARRDDLGWGVDLWPVGADAPAASWRGEVLTGAGGVLHFAGGALRFIAVESGRVVVRELPLSQEAARTPHGRVHARAGPPGVGRMARPQ